MERKEYNSLEDIVKRLKDSKKKTTLLYAFNGTGKTRLSMRFRELINPSSGTLAKKRVIYYNAFTEDLFNWENDLDGDVERILKINTNSMFVDLMKDYGKELEIIKKFQEFTMSKIEPLINYTNGEIRFRLATGDNRYADNIKISRGEEQIFIWVMFYILIDTVISDLNINESSDRSLAKFSDLRYIFIDDPISSLDDNHAIDVALDLCGLIKNSKNERLHFIISTHHPFFFNVLHTELKDADKYILKRNNESYVLERIKKQSPFGYHLLLKEEIECAIKTNTVKRYHFNLLRNLLEKSAHFLGYVTWRELINEDDKEAYIKRINSYSHSDHTDLEIEQLEPQEVNLFKRLYDNFIDETKWKE